MQVYSIPLDQEKRETTQQGEKQFPLAVYYSVMSRNVLGYIPLHWHEEIQYCVVTKGSVNFYVNEEKYLLETGEGMFVGSAYLHMAKPASLPDSSYICLDISPRLLSGFPGSVMEREYVLPFISDPSFACMPIRRKTSWQIAILDAIQEIYQLNEIKNAGYELRILSRLYTIFAETVTHRPEKTCSKKPSNANTVVQKIVSYIAEHFSDKITLSELSACTAYTPNECCRIFKRFTGESIFTYLKAFRLEQSAYLLQQTDEPISGIAYACGFSSTSYFIKCFHKQFSTTPLQYRKK